jgi:hypothetical protein
LPIARWKSDKAGKTESLRRILTVESSSSELFSKWQLRHIIATFEQAHGLLLFLTGMKDERKSIALHDIDMFKAF